MIAGFSEPIVFGVIILIIVFVTQILPLLMIKKSTTDYNNFDLKWSNAFWTFAGRAGPGYTNVKLDDKRRPIYHGDGKWTLHLENGVSMYNVTIDESSKENNCRLKKNAEAFLGIRVDVLCNIDANSCIQDWDSYLVDNWGTYRERIKEAAKHEVIDKELRDKELVDEMKGSVSTVPIMPENSPFK